MASGVIQLENVTKVYTVGKGKVQALRGISIAIEEGEFISIIGPSGSGKSTLLHIIGCLDRPTSGNVLIEGVETSRLNDFELAKLRGKRIGFVFQSFNLYPILNAQKNVELPMIIQGVAPSERQKQAEKLLSEVRLGDRMKHLPSELSSGEQQRVAIASALANDPVILLADEPTGNLDSKTGQEILDIFKEFNEKGKTIVTVTHNMDVAKMADRTLIMKDGQIEVHVN